MTITSIRSSVVHLISASLTAAVVLIGSALAPNLANASLIAFYDFEDDVLDSSGNANNGTVNGTTTYSTDVAAAISGRSTKSFNFNGSTYIALPTDFVGTAQATGATLSMWVQSANPQNQTYTFSAGNSGNSTVIYGVQGDAANNDHARFFYRPDAGGNNFTAGTADVFGDGWHHLLLTDDGDVVNLYVDGALDSTLDYPDAGLFPLTSNLNSLGALVRNSSGFFLTGQMDEAAIYDTVLTSQQISLLASGASPDNLTLVPEPSTFLLAGLGFVGLVLLQRRSNRL